MKKNNILQKKSFYLSKILTTLIIVLMILSLSHYVNAETLTYTSQSSKGSTINWSYEVSESGNVVNLKCTNPTEVIGAVEIPSTIDEKTVISLGSKCLSGASGITELTIPDTIMTIGSAAFENCTGIKNIEIPDNVSKIEERTFYGCSGLKTVIFPENLTTIYSGWTLDGAFRQCSGLSVIDFRNTNLTTIGTGSFGGCGNIDLILPDTLSTIDKSAFDDITDPTPKTVIGTIYGNEGSYAQEYATANNIKFDLIENYGKSEGEDITAPTVTAIKVTSPDSGTYQAGQKITIQVKFSETITAETMPTLKIKFGIGEERTLTKGVLSENTITYTYTIASGDNGQLLTTSLSGGNVQDEAGNEAELSTPIISGNAIVANVGGTNNGSGSGSGSGSNGTSQSGSSSASGSQGTSTSNDSTVANTKLPQTGEGITVGIAIVVITALGIITFIKVRKYKEIK